MYSSGSAHAGTVVVTLATVLLYYAFQIHVLRVKVRLDRAYDARGAKFDRYFGQDREMLAADRIQLNLLEHMTPFLALLWMESLFVSPAVATGAGAFYVVARAAYPFLMGGRLGRGVKAQIFLSTGVGYLVLTGLALHLLWALIT